MKQKRVISLTLIFVLFLSFVSTLKVYADEGSLWVNPESMRESGWQYYTIDKPIWKFKNKAGEHSPSEETKTLYCLRGGPGFSNVDDMGNSISGLKPREYTKKFDMNNPSSIPEAYQSAIPTINSPEYKKLMWVLNKLYVPAKATASSEEKDKAEKYKQYLLHSAGINPDPEERFLTDDDIDVVQQLAVWYYAKNVSDAYKQTTFSLMINPEKNKRVDSIRDFISIIDYKEFPGDRKGDFRQEDAMKLYRYFLNNADENYVYNYGNQKIPISLDNTNPSFQEKNGKYIVGPFKFTKVRDAIYAVEAVITTNKGEIRPEIVEKSGEDFIVDGNKILRDYIELQKEFYLQLPSDESITDIKFAYRGNFIDTKVTYWSVRDGAYLGLNKEQPIVEIERNYTDFEDEITVTRSNKKIDLALRKSITKLNEVEPAINRLPRVDATKLNVTDYTAKYNHPKNDLLAANNENIEYTITVYNEGNKDAYAAEIKDYLPKGIEFVEVVSDTSKYSANVVKNSDGTSIITITNNGKTTLKAFDRDTMTTPDSEAVVIRCKVTLEPEVTSRLVNIAEISKYYDVEANKELDTDRDSKSNNFPDGIKYTSDYKGNGQDGEYILGQEDDDDFEPIIINGKKRFDLALRKFIIKVGKLDYVVDQNGSGYVREPKVDITNLTPNGTKNTTAVYNHSKKPVPVKVGDEVIFMLRVYNEGQVDGYANEIKDYLPECLEFLPLDSFNTARGWTYYKDPVSGKVDKRIVVTDYLSEEKDPEANLIKAFDGENLSYKEVAIKCKVVKTENMPDKITNIAEITKDSNDDIDSQTDNVTIPTDDKLPTYKDDESNKKYVPGQEDDDDFEKLIIEEFDLALRKFITKIGNKDITSRIPQFVIEDGKYVYKHDKTPLEVDTGDVVTYTIRVYNEGNFPGYASEITDDIPKGLEFLPENEVNTMYRWKMIDADGKETTDSRKAVKIITDYLSKDNEKVKGQYLLEAFDPLTMKEPDYKEVKVSFKVIAANTTQGIITNYAQITEDTDEDGGPIDDSDSDTEKWQDGDDDQDVEHIKLTRFDLALRKFITKVNNKDIVDRVPVFSIKDGKYVYNHTKEPIVVENGNTIIYTIRVYNEGTKAGYASEITDDIPKGLEFLPDNEVNKNYRWKMIDAQGKQTTDPKKAVDIKTDYLSKANEKQNGDNLLQPFEPSTMKEPDFKEVKAAFKVVEPNTSDRIVINKAQITDDSDKDGNPVIDDDSVPEEWRDGDDDQDIEKIRVKYFDLSLKKWVTQAIIIENGKERVIESGHTGDENPEPPIKVELVARRINKVVVKFRYKIKITNEGEIAGYATEISDYIPEGLKFVAEDNPEWREVEGKVVTDQLKDTLLQPGESATVEILLTWINGKNNFGEKINVAEISKDKNDSNTPDIDSIPNNKVDGEDDIDIAPVVLSVKTGEVINKMEYIVTGLGVVIILITGITLIKKYILY